MSETERQTWTLLYASILGIAYHPRQMETGKPALTPEEAARAADAAMAPYRERFGDGSR